MFFIFLKIVCVLVSWKGKDVEKYTWEVFMGYIWKNAYCMRLFYQLKFIYIVLFDCKDGLEIIWLYAQEVEENIDFGQQ